MFIRIKMAPQSEKHIIKKVEDIMFISSLRCESKRVLFIIIKTTLEEV